MDGIYLLDKPIAWTSHDLVDAVRRKTGQRAVGHAGTLDPMATGLMILLLGKATKRSVEFSGLDKSYRGSIRLGVRTDSWDLEGRVLEERPVPELAARTLSEVFGQMTGERLLLPPIFSAIKRGGQRAHAVARRGEVLEMEPRPMNIYQLVLDAYDAPEVYFSVDCSKGTYVRSLAYDLGERLGCGGTLSSLVRTRIGDLRLDQAIGFNEFAGLGAAAELESRLIP